MTHQDYETIDADMHAKSQHDAKTFVDLIRENSVLLIRLRELEARNQSLEHQIKSMRENPLQKYTESGIYDPDEGL